MPRWSPRARWLSAAGGSVVLAGALLLILQRGIASRRLNCRPLDDLASSTSSPVATAVARLRCGYAGTVLPVSLSAAACLLSRTRRRCRPCPQLAARLVTQLWRCGDRQSCWPCLSHFAPGLAAIDDSRRRTFRHRQVSSIMSNAGWRRAWPLSAPTLSAICFCLRSRQRPSCFGYCWAIVTAATVSRDTESRACRRAVALSSRRSEHDRSCR